MWEALTEQTMGGKIFFSVPTKRRLELLSQCYSHICCQIPNGFIGKVVNEVSSNVVSGLRARPNVPSVNKLQLWSPHYVVVLGP